MTKIETKTIELTYRQRETIKMALLCDLQTKGQSSFTTDMLVECMRLMKDE